MEKNLGDIRKLLKYEFELGHNAKQAVTNINRAKGAETVAYTTAKRWFSKFRSGNLETDDKMRFGRPREVDRDAVVNTVEDHSSMTTHMLWDRRGIIHWELLEKGETINANLYCEQLERVRQKLRNRRVPVIFLQDNARPHVAHQTLQKIRDMNWERLEHPLYSSDLSPSDYYLFRSMEHWL
uniref:Mos1 transposase HTH domain-containing protein n=1 Tax=Acrobeloides nanus TaxID=290746 RepID=A0A914D1S0_9BILA